MTHESGSHSVTSDFLRPHRLQPTRLLCPWNSPDKNTGVSYQFLLKGIFPTQGSNSSLLHCRWILYCLSHQGSWKRPFTFFYSWRELVGREWVTRGVRGTRGWLSGAAVEHVCLQAPHFILVTSPSPGKSRGCHSSNKSETEQPQLGLELTVQVQKNSRSFNWDHYTWSQDLLKIRFLISHHRKNSVRDKVIGKKWIHLEINTPDRMWAIPEAQTGTG